MKKGCSATKVNLLSRNLTFVRIDLYVYCFPVNRSEMFRSRWTTGIIENNLSTWNVFAAQDQAMTYDLIYSWMGHEAVSQTFLLWAPMSCQNFNFRWAFYRDSNASCRVSSFITHRWARIVAHTRWTGKGTNGSRTVFILSKIIRGYLNARKSESPSRDCTSES